MTSVTFTTSGTSHVLPVGHDIELATITDDGTNVAMYVGGVTVASLKGVLAATFTLGAVDTGSDGFNDFYGLTIGGLTDATSYTVVYK